jgi:hypothetical protein
MHECRRTIHNSAPHLVLYVGMLKSAASYVALLQVLVVTKAMVFCDARGIEQCGRTLFSSALMIFF